VTADEAMARVGTLHAPSELTYQSAGTVLDHVLADTSLPVKQLSRAGNVRAGFLSALSELMAASIEKKPVQKVRISTAIASTSFASWKLPPFPDTSETDVRSIRSFEGASRPARPACGRERDSSFIYGASGPLAGIPILISYQPKWWLQVDLVLQTCTIHLVNPSDISFGTAVITPRWLYVLAAATPREYGDPRIIDETLEPIDYGTIAAGDVVGIGIHTFNALRGYEIGREARKRGAHVVFGGIHPTLYPNEAHELGGAHVAVKGDGDVVWATVIADCLSGNPAKIYDGGRVNGVTFSPARWDLLPADKYMWGSVQTLRGCPKHCSFCSVWKTDGQQPRQRTADAVIREIVELRRMGFRFILLSDDNFYPVTVEDLRLAERQGNVARLESLHEIRRERFELMDKLAKLPNDLVFYTQITMEAAEDPSS
jgi:hypothetical protein